jgi:hypothetical protein
MRLNYLLIAAIVLVSCLPAHAQLRVFRENYKTGYKDASGRVVVQATYDAGSEMKDGFAIIMKGSRRGYINAKGEEVIACKYDDASLFEQGLACVQLNGKYGYINTKAEWVLLPIYDNAFSFRDGLARICKNARWGMINPHGIIVIPLIYDRLYDISDGLIAASVDGASYVYLNARGQVVIHSGFLTALPFDEQTHRAIVRTKDGSYYINKKGALLEELKDEEEEEHKMKAAAFK